MSQYSTSLEYTPVAEFYEEASIKYGKFLIRYAASK
jgi:hypothetical protein